MGLTQGLPNGGSKPRSQHYDQKTMKWAKCTGLLICLHSIWVCSFPVPLEMRRASLGYNTVPALEEIIPHSAIDFLVKY